MGKSEKEIVRAPSRAGDHEALPNWPALMDDTLARAYCGGICEASFNSLAARYSVAPVDMGMRVRRWRKADLDRLVDRLPVRGDPRDGAPVVDIAHVALEAARRRRR